MPLIRINRQPTSRQLAVFGAAWAIFCGFWAVGAWRHQHAVTAAGLSITGIGIPLLGVVFPKALRWLYVGLSYATYPIGFAVSHVVLAVIYYLVITPLGLAMRCFGYDPLRRRFDRARPTYWQLRRDPGAPETYFRQN